MFAYLPHFVRHTIVASMQTQNDINIPRFIQLSWHPLTRINAFSIQRVQTEKVPRLAPVQRISGTNLFVLQKNNNQLNVVRLTHLNTFCMSASSDAYMQGALFGKAEHGHPQLSRLCRSCESMSVLLLQRLSGGHPRNRPQSTPKSISKEPRNKKNLPRLRSQQVATFVGIFSFGESDGMIDKQQNSKANWGKCFALPHKHQAKLGLLHDTPRKGARRKTQQTAFGRLAAILDVWWFHPEMGGFTKVSKFVFVHAKKIVTLGENGGSFKGLLSVFSRSVAA